MFGLWLLINHPMVWLAGFLAMAAIMALSLAAARK